MIPAVDPGPERLAARPAGLLVAVVGPTAAGKTALSLQLAHALDGEVINADSMQLYQGMDIGTAKLRPDQREGVPHHALDLWPVTEPASVAEYQRVARAAIEQVWSRGRTALLVGGSGLYVRAVLDRFEFPGTDAGLRQRLETELAELGPQRLHARLTTRDPAAAQRILPSNGRRIVRALEVTELTGAPFPAQLPEPRPYYAAVQLGVDLEPAALDERVARRVDAMWADGLRDEVRALERVGLRDGLTASRALGYQQLLRHLADEAGYGLDQARLDTVTATRRFVRRQRSWFRRDPRIVWLDGAVETLTRVALAHVRTAASAMSVPVGVGSPVVPATGEG